MSAPLHELIPLRLVAVAAAGGVGGDLLAGAVATTVLATMVVPFKCEVRKLAVVNKGTSVNVTPFVLDFRLRPTAGTAVGDASMGTITRPTAAVSTQGKEIYKIPATRQIALPGQEIALVVSTANGDADTVSAFVWVERIPEEEANIAAEIASA